MVVEIKRIIIYLKNSVGCRATRDIDTTFFYQAQTRATINHSGFEPLGNFTSNEIGKPLD